MTHIQQGTNQHREALIQIANHASDNFQAFELGATFAINHILELIRAAPSAPAESLIPAITEYRDGASRMPRSDEDLKAMLPDVDQLLGPSREPLL